MSLNLPCSLTRRSRSGLPLAYRPDLGVYTRQLRKCLSPLTSARGGVALEIRRWEDDVGSAGSPPPISTFRTMLVAGHPLARAAAAALEAR